MFNNGKFKITFMYTLLFNLSLTFRTTRNTTFVAYWFANVIRYDADILFMCNNENTAFVLAINVNRKIDRQIPWLIAAWANGVAWYSSMHFAD